MWLAFGLLVLFAGAALAGGAASKKSADAKRTIALADPAKLAALEAAGRAFRRDAPANVGDVGRTFFRVPPWVAKNAEALTGYTAAEKAKPGFLPAFRVYDGRDGHAADIVGLVNRDSERRFLEQMASGRRWLTNSQAQDPRNETSWSTWNAFTLQAAATAFEGWDFELGANLDYYGTKDPRVNLVRAELRYAAALFRSMHEAADAAADVRWGRKSRAETDPVIKTCMAFLQGYVDFLEENQGEIIAGVLTLVVAGEVSTAFASALLGLASGVAYAGPAGVTVTVLATLVLAIYVFAAGIRPGTTRGSGDDVIQFPLRGGRLLKVSDVDAYGHGMYRAFELALARARGGR